MKRTLWLLLLLAVPCSATTKIRLHNSPSAISGCKAMDLSLGPIGNAVITSVTTTTSAGNDIQATDTGGGNALKWCSEPFSSTTTISGTITFNFYTKESATSVNSTIRAKLILYHNGAETTTISDCGFATELTASIAAKNWSTASGGWTACSVTSTSLSVGDRVVLYLFVNGCTTTCTVAGGGMAAGSVTMDYDGGTDAADGSSWVQLNETETFSVETAGHMIIVGIQSQTASGWSVSDDGGNTYNTAAFCNTGNFAIIFYALNVSAARKITVTHSSGTAGYFSARAAEVTNIPIGSALDVSTTNCQIAASGSATAGSFTPSQNGEFLFNMVFDGTWPETTDYTLGTQSTCTWAFIESNLSDAQATQWCVQGTAAAINPTLTKHDSGNEWWSIAAAFKQSGGNPVPIRWSTTPNMSNVGQTSAAGANMVLYLPDPSGTATTGMYMEGKQMETYETGRTSPQVHQFTHTGNLVIVAAYGGNTDRITAISSTPSHTWTSLGNVVSATNHVNSTIWCSDTGNSGTETLSLSDTMNNSPSNSDDQVMILGVTGASSTACADAASHKGNAIGNKTGVSPVDVSSGGTTSGSLSITPSSSTSLIVAVLPVDFNTVNAVTNGQIQNCYLSSNSLANTPYCENNGAVTMQNHATSSFEWVWALQSGLGANTAEWVSNWAEFLAPAAGGTPAKTLLLMGVGD